jgi:hypothetical protein
MPRSISPSESHLKAQILNELRRSRRISAVTIIANELPLGSTGVRADLALLSRSMTGIEIKSDRDSLKRLERQLSVYKETFDRTILVIGSKHWDDADDLDLSDVEVWVARGMTLRRIREAPVVQNDEKRNLLLPRSQASKFERSLPLREHERMFRHLFAQRFSATSSYFWEQTSARRIEAKDLAFLSRFQEQRENLSNALAANNKSKRAWLDELTQSFQSSSVLKKDDSSL